jgi:hypothetical protein
MCWRNYPLKIRFNGEQHKRGVPICELNTTLAAIQRMFCRAYMLTEQDTVGLAYMAQAERLRCSLRIAAKDWSSRKFSLDWFAKASFDDFYETRAEDILALLHQALDLYIRSSVSLVPSNDIERLALAIYNDVQEIASRIGQTGNLQSIEIAFPGGKTCLFDNRIHDYVNSLKGLTYDGKTQDLEARVATLKILDRDYVQVRSQTHQMKLYADNKNNTQQLVDWILQELAASPRARRQQPWFRFHGKPRFKIGGDPVHNPEFVVIEPYTPEPCPP